MKYNQTIIKLIFSNVNIENGFEEFYLYIKENNFNTLYYLDLSHNHIKEK